MKNGMKKKASGGIVAEDPPVKEAYAGGSSNVAKEAEERKRGGKVKKNIGKVEGKKSAMRLDRPGRKSGGRVGCDSAPLSSASKTSHVMD